MQNRKGMGLLTPSNVPAPFPSRQHHPQTNQTDHPPSSTTTQTKTHTGILFPRRLALRRRPRGRVAGLRPPGPRALAVGRGHPRRGEPGACLSVCVPSSSLCAGRSGMDRAGSERLADAWSGSPLSLLCTSNTHHSHAPPLPITAVDRDRLRALLPRLPGALPPAPGAGKRVREGKRERRLAGDGDCGRGSMTEREKERGGRWRLCEGADGNHT